MKATLEISLYPLTERYSAVVTAFILKVRKYKGLEVHTNGMSTQIFGDYDQIMKVMTQEMKKILEEERAIFILKIGKGELKEEHLPDALKN